jgi:hypothetical protein
MRPTFQPSHATLRRFACVLLACALFSAAFAAAPAQPTARAAGPRLVIADYMMWYQVDTFDGKQSFDVPAAGGYNSDDLETIQRQLALAQRACLDGFSAHWFGAKEPRTTANFTKLLQASSGSNMHHAVVLLQNSLPGIKEADLIDSVRYVLSNWAGHPNYLRIDGKPVIFFEAMQRPWGGTGAAQKAWARIRAAADPNRSAIWFAEGLNTNYNPLFDGLYVYRIDHRNDPGAYRKQPAYAAALRRSEAAAGQKLYFADSIAPGFDDSRSIRIKKFDIRSPAPAFVRARRDGAYYRDTFQPTLNTGGDLLLVKSFNEWIEGTAIEPGRTYGDLYMNLTCELGNAYRNPPPPTPTAVPPTAVPTKAPATPSP